MAIRRMPFAHKQAVARLRGEAAYLNNKKLSDNPYSLGELRQAWENAYIAAFNASVKKLVDSLT